MRPPRALWRCHFGKADSLGGRRFPWQFSGSPRFAFEKAVASAESAVDWKASRARTDPPLLSNLHRKEGKSTMPEVTVRKGEPIDRALKRLKRKLETEGIMDEVRRLRAFETPTQRTNSKAKASAKRAKAKQQRFHLA